MTQAIRTIRIAKQGPAGAPGLYPQPSWVVGDAPYVRGTVLRHDGNIWLALRDTSAEPGGGVPDDWASWLDFEGLVEGVATLGEDGKIPLAQLPAIAITDTFEVVSQAEMLALAAERGDIAIRSDLNKCFALGSEPASTLANWKELKTPTDAVLSVAGRTGAVTLTKSDVGLDNVPNADATARANHTGTQDAATITGLAAVATSGSAADLGSGTLPDARLSSNVGLLGSAQSWTAQNTFAAGTITTSQPFTLTQTWNASGVAFAAFRVSVTNTASASGSQLADFQVGGASMWTLDKSGNVTVPASTLKFNSNNPGGTIVLCTNNNERIRFIPAGDVNGIGISGAQNLILDSGVQLRFNSQNYSSSAAIVYEAAQTLAQRNQTNAQTFRVYNTYSSASNYERLELAWESNVARIKSAAQTGSVRAIAIDGFSKSGAVASGDIPQGSFAVIKDTSGGGVVLAYNDGGTLKTVALS